jgi:putative SOS response-associated peptidase YedK
MERSCAFAIGDKPMCGRYVAILEEARLAEWHLVRRVPPFESYNIAPTQSVPIVRHTNEGNAADMLRWGLIPFFAKGVPPKYSTINATIERIKDGPAWRAPWNRGQRCAVLASGFYEWQVQADGKTKMPFYITLDDQRIFGIAGLWDTSIDTKGNAVESCTMVTMPANRLMAQIHNSKRRMIAILAKEDRDVWLCGKPDEAFKALKQYPEAHLVAHPVSTRVNSPRNNDAKLVEPI